jgi:outer membrane protein assembly factor BamA
MTSCCVVKCASLKVHGCPITRWNAQAAPPGAALLEEVDFEKKRVDGSDDLVDVEFTIKEGPSAQLAGGIGYSQSSSFMLNGNYADSNFLGTGRRLAFDVNIGQYASR